MATRGFFAELQRQSLLEKRQRERQAREQEARGRRIEQMRKADERARAQFARAEASELKRLEKAAREAHVAFRIAEVEGLNSDLADLYANIDSLLEFTLQCDDYVDLAKLRIEVIHPPFDREDLEEPVPLPLPLFDPAQPVLELPTAPGGLAGFFGKKKHAKAVEEAERFHVLAMNEWKTKCEHLEARRQEALEKHASDEQERLEQLARERARYSKECRVREENAAASNKKLEELITNLGYGTVDAIQEYVSIVLSNSVYPEQFPVNHEFKFDPESAELDLRVVIPEPAKLPNVKAYKYTKASDEIATSTLSQKECRERYTSAVHQIALRSFHEVFEADRRGLIRTISLEIGTTAIDLATGLPVYIPFVIAAAERDVFITFDLSAVVPEMTLARLGAAVSKNPYGLAPAERAGVRRA